MALSFLGDAPHSHPPSPLLTGPSITQHKEKSRIPERQDKGELRRVLQLEINYTGHGGKPGVASLWTHKETVAPHKWLSSPVLAPGMDVSGEETVWG